MSFTLYYLPLRARAEPIRMMLHYGNVPYHDVTVSLREWSTHKEALDICPFGQLPSIKLQSGEVIAESGAILRLAAKLAGLYPVDPLEAARADMVNELANDMNAINAILNFWPLCQSDYDVNRANYFKNFVKYAAYAEKLLGNKYYFGGSQPQYGDFSLFHIMNIALLVEPACLHAYPRLAKWVDAMQNMPRLKQYLEQRETVRNIGMMGSLIQRIKPVSEEYQRENWTAAVVEEHKRLAALEKEQVKKTQSVLKEGRTIFDRSVITVTSDKIL